VNAIESKHAASIVSRVLAPVDGGIVLARVLLLCFLVAVLASTSLAIAFEITLYVAFAISP